MRRREPRAISFRDQGRERLTAPFRKFFNGRPEFGLQRYAGAVARDGERPLFHVPV